MKRTTQHTLLENTTWVWQHPVIHLVREGTNPFLDDIGITPTITGHSTRKSVISRVYEICGFRTRRMMVQPTLYRTVIHVLNRTRIQNRRHVCLRKRFWERKYEESSRLMMSHPSPCFCSGVCILFTCLCKFRTSIFHDSLRSMIRTDRRCTQ